MRYFHILVRVDITTVPRKCLDYLDTDTMRYIYTSKYIYITKREKRQGKKAEDATRTITDSGSRPNHEGTRLMFASGTVSPMTCPSDGQQKDDKKGQAGDKARRGQRQGAKTKRRPQQGCRFSLKLFCLVFWVIRCDIA